MKNTNYPHIHRDISWLSFNYRVLQEAKDKRVPLLERIKFLAIYSSNLDEFFRVRVANHRNILRIDKKAQKKLDYDPAELLLQIQQIVNEQQIEFSNIFQLEIIPELKKNNIQLLRRGQLNKKQRSFIVDFFENNLLPYVQPVILVKNKIRPFLNNAALYLAIHLQDKHESDRRPTYAIVKIPSDHIDRFIKLPSNPGKHAIMMLDEIVRNSIKGLFPGYKIIDEYSIKLTRDGELYIDDEYSGDLIDKIRKSLVKRSIGPASRLVYDKEMPKELLSYLQEILEVEKSDLFPEGRYHNNFDFFNFPNFGKLHLMNSPLPPLPYLPLEEAKDFWAAIKEKDHLIHVPYQSYESVIRFFEYAAKDPSVTHIKIVQYRVAKKSRVMAALMAAVDAGKNVSVFVEVKARFDEAANLEWGEKLEEAGVHVRYSFPGVKVHSKIALVRKIENNKPIFYAYLSTGNFHEGNARLYTDYGLFTNDKRLTIEVGHVFSHLENREITSDSFKHLLVGRFNLKDTLKALIHAEIEQAKAGNKSGIILKVNSLQEEEMVKLLYEANQAGVPIKLIVRGICSIVSGIPNVSENIEAISIVDRYLEHSRIFIFHNSGHEHIYLSSADWMYRNLNTRVETVFPIYNETYRKQILDYLDAQLKDNVKARYLSHDRLNEYQKTNTGIAYQSQLETYLSIKRNIGNQENKNFEKIEIENKIEEPNTAKNTIPTKNHSSLLKRITSFFTSK